MGTPEPNPDIWGFRRDANGILYITKSDLDSVMEGMPALQPGELVAALGAVATMVDRGRRTDHRLDALGRLRRVGLVNDTQAEVVIRSIYQGG